MCLQLQRRMHEREHTDIQTRVRPIAKLTHPLQDRQMSQSPRPPKESRFVHARFALVSPSGTWAVCPEIRCAGRFMRTERKDQKKKR